MSKEPACDYELSKQQADWLKGASVLPRDMRIKTLERIMSNFGSVGLIQMFADFIGMANSVIANNREAIELYLMTDCGHSDRLAEKINLPTLFGALNGVSIAIEPTPLMCGSCAFRLGTPANQSPVTVIDAAQCVDDSDLFLCHEDVEPNKEPTRICAGYAKSKQENDHERVEKDSRANASQDRR